MELPNIIIPKPGTVGFDQFVRKSLIPGSPESIVMDSINRDAQNQIQQQLRNMLYSMIEDVPGQVFRDVSRFNSKFGVTPTDHPTHELPEDILLFRALFMLEELQEYLVAVGCEIIQLPDGSLDIIRNNNDGEPPHFDPEKALDSLVDLVYVTIGAAFLHRFKFNEAWARVQAANMAKERATGADDSRSKRKHSLDIVKPDGWKPPDLSDLIGPAEPRRCECSPPGGPLKKIIEVAGTNYCEICGGTCGRPDEA